MSSRGAGVGEVVVDVGKVGVAGNVLGVREVVVVVSGAEVDGVALISSCLFVV